MWTLIFCIALVVGGIYLEKRFSPRVQKDGSGYWIHYNSQKGTRDKTHLFNV